MSARFERRGGGLLALAACLTAACGGGGERIASPPPADPAAVAVVPAASPAVPPPAAILPPAMLDFGLPPARPARARLFDFTARDAPLRDVLDPLARDMGLNVTWARGVDPAAPVTVAFSNVALDAALQGLFQSTDYFYRIEGDNLLVKATDTRFFEIGFVPSRVGSEIQVGGDVLGQIGQDGGPRGKFAVSGATDEKTADVWGQIDDGVRSLLSETGKLSINRLSGTVIVTDDKAHLQQVEGYLAEVRTSLSRQVIVDVKVVEVGLDHKTSTGVDWSGLLNIATSKGKIQLSGAQGLALPNAAVQLVVSGTEGQTLLNALAERGNLNVLSQPRLNILNGQTAVINVGRVVVFWELKGIPGGSLGGQGVVVPEQKSVLAGILLGVTAHIESDGFVTLQVVPIITSIGDMRVFEFQGSRLQAPDLDIRGTSTVVGVHDGQTVVIGGLLTTRKKTVQSKVPLLGDVPVLGRLFRRHEDEESKVELALLLTPQVVNRK